jgi:hypothetical protein
VLFRKEILGGAKGIKAFRNFVFCVFNVGTEGEFVVNDNTEELCLAYFMDISIVDSDAVEASVVGCAVVGSVFAGYKHIVGFAEVELKRITIEVGNEPGEIGNDASFKFCGVCSTAV